ncbi:MAG: C40 family peptidase [Aeromicrobium sp.]
MRITHRAIIALLSAALMATLVIGSTATPTSALSASNATKVLKKAASLKGTPYKWGGTTRRGFDCSGYTQYVFKHVLKRNIGRVVSQQATKGHAVNRSSKKRGDLIIFVRGGRKYHVGIYAGAGRIWHASRPGVPVKKERIWTSAYRVRRL